MNKKLTVKILIIIISAYGYHLYVKSNKTKNYSYAYESDLITGGKDHFQNDIYGPNL